MTRPASIVEEDHDRILTTYLRALARDHGVRPAASPGHEVRTCPSCGARAVFTLDPEGTWYRCRHCGHFAYPAPSGPDRSRSGCGGVANG
ncbi:MAG: hypothetical protein ACRDI0_07580 [Actinomycetota bacterium]